MLLGCVRNSAKAALSFNEWKLDGDEVSIQMTVNRMVVWKGVVTDFEKDVDGGNKADR